MAIIDVTGLADSELKSYDQMMVRVALTVDEVAPLSVAVWSDVLKELSSRKLVTLVSGSFDQVSNSLISRNY